MALGGLGFVGRIGKGVKVVRKLAKAEKLEQKTVQTGRTVTEAKPVLGGSYAEVRKAHTGGEVHHIPADSASSIPRDKGPAIWMEAEDHWRTGSYKRGSKPDLYRREQKALIEAGNYRGALSKDFWDLRKNFGKKYDEAFKQSIEYAKKLPEFQKGAK